MQTKLFEIARMFNQMVFSLQLAGYKACDPAWNRTGRIYPSHGLWIVSKGRGDFVLDGSPFTAEPGDLIVFAPGTVYDRQIDPEEPLEYYFIRFSYAVAYEEKDEWHFAAADAAPFPLHGVYRLQNPPPVLNLCEQIRQSWPRRGQTAAARRKLLFQEMLLSILQDFRARTVAGSTTLAIERTIDHMVQHYKKKMTLEDLAHLAGLSASHYSRLFKKYTGLSPIEYLTQLRVDRAKELLVISDYRLKGIAQSVGYGDEFYFSRIFKKVVGQSPREFALKNKLKRLP